MAGAMLGVRQAKLHGDSGGDLSRSGVDVSCHGRICMGAYWSGRVAAPLVGGDGSYEMDRGQEWQRMAADWATWRGAKLSGIMLRAEGCFWTGSGRLESGVILGLDTLEEVRRRDDCALIEVSGWTECTG